MLIKEQWYSLSRIIDLFLPLYKISKFSPLLNSINLSFSRRYIKKSINHIHTTSRAMRHCLSFFSTKQKFSVYPWIGIVIEDTMIYIFVPVPIRVTLIKRNYSFFFLHLSHRSHNSSIFFRAAIYSYSTTDSLETESKHPTNQT